MNQHDDPHAFLRVNAAGEHDPTGRWLHLASGELAYCPLKPHERPVETSAPDRAEARTVEAWRRIYGREAADDLADRIAERKDEDR